MNDGPTTTATSNFGDKANGQAKSRWMADSVCETSPLDAVVVRRAFTINGFGICAVMVDWSVLLNHEYPSPTPSFFQTRTVPERSMSNPLFTSYGTVISAGSS